MIISMTPADRFPFHSAVAAQDIQFLLNDLNSQLYYTAPNSLATSLLGALLLTPVPMGFGDYYRLPYELIDFEMSLLQDPSIRFQAKSLSDGFRIFITRCGPCFEHATLFMEFDGYLTLRQFGINFSPFAECQFHERRLLMNAAFMDLPTILGYIVDTNSRQRTTFTLSDPHQFTARGGSPDSFQNIGDILQVTNPRDNETGITKRPHERAGHTRQLPDGRIVDVQPTVVHRDGYEPDGSPRKLKR